MLYKRRNFCQEGKCLLETMTGREGIDLGSWLVALQERLHPWAVLHPNKSNPAHLDKDVKVLVLRQRKLSLDGIS